MIFVLSSLCYYGDGTPSKPPAPPVINPWGATLKDDEHDMFGRPYPWADDYDEYDEDGMYVGRIVESESESEGEASDESDDSEGEESDGSEDEEHDDNNYNTNHYYNHNGVHVLPTVPEDSALGYGWRREAATGARAA